MLLYPSGRYNLNFDVCAIVILLVLIEMEIIEVRERGREIGNAIRLNLCLMGASIFEFISLVFLNSRIDRLLFPAYRINALATIFQTASIFFFFEYMFGFSNQRKIKKRKQIIAMLPMIVADVAIIVPVCSDRLITWAYSTQYTDRSLNYILTAVGGVYFFFITFGIIKVRKSIKKYFIPLILLSIIYLISVIVGTIIPILKASNYMLSIAALIAEFIEILIQGEESREDTLTKIMNRRGFQNWAMNFIRKGKRQAIIIAIDINNFKQVNDRYGHDAGDQVLISFAADLKKIVKKQGYVARSGGDEFQILFIEPSEGDLDAVKSFIEKEHEADFEGNTIKYTCSGGYAAFPEQGRELTGLCQCADRALYHSKLLRNQVFYKYDDSMKKDWRDVFSFSLNDFTKNMPLPMLICQNNKDFDVLYANAECLSFFECDNLLDFKDFVNGNKMGGIFPEDIDKVKYALEERMKSKNGEIYYTNYRIVTKIGRVKCILDVGNLVNSEALGNVFFSMIIDTGKIGSCKIL